MKKSRKDIISMRDFSKEEILHILKISEEVEKDENKGELLKGKIISTLFFEPSTRTRLSFQSAAQRLGAQVLGFDSPDGTSVKKGETFASVALEDACRYAAEDAFVTLKLYHLFLNIALIKHINTFKRDKYESTHII